MNDSNEKTCLIYSETCNSCQTKSIVETSYNHDPHRTNSIEAKSQSRHNTKSCDKLNDTKYKTYKRRWWILFVGALMPFLQNYLTNTWTVIAVSVGPTFGWSNSQISLMQAWYGCMFLVFFLPFSWLMQSKGLRLPMIIAACFMFTASVLRCISMSPPVVSWLDNLSNCLLGAMQPVTSTSSSVISALWFPPHQRTTSTSLLAISGFMGYAVCFLIDPLFASTPVPETNHLRNESSHIQYQNLGEIRSEIRQGRLLDCALSACALLAVLIYFPNKPPRPPSPSAAKPRLDYVSSIKALFQYSHLNFWVICIANGISVSVFTTWSSLLTVNFGTMLPQTEIGYIGCVTNVMGTIAAISFGKVADKFLNHKKLVVLLLSCLAVFVTYWILLIAMQYIPLSKTQLYIAISLQGIAVCGHVGIMFEIGVEVNYPIPEIVTMTAELFTYNIFTLVFLFVFFIPNIGVAWMNWFLYVSFLLCVPLVLIFKENNKRLATDNNNNLEISI